MHTYCCLIARITQNTYCHQNVVPFYGDPAYVTGSVPRQLCVKQLPTDSFSQRNRMHRVSFLKRHHLRVISYTICIRYRSTRLRLSQIWNFVNILLQSTRGRFLATKRQNHRLSSPISQFQLFEQALRQLPVSCCLCCYVAGEEWF